MVLDPNAFMTTMEKRISFSETDKALLQANAAWGTSIAKEMADVFYAYLARDEEMNAILTAKEGRMHRLNETFIDDVQFKLFLKMVHASIELNQNLSTFNGKDFLIHVPAEMLKECMVIGLAKEVSMAEVVVAKSKLEG